MLVTDPTMLECPEVQDLQRKGHRIGTWADLFQQAFPVEAIDVIVGPTCWRLPKALLPMYLPLVVKNARKARFPSKKESER